MLLDYLIRTLQATLLLCFIAGFLYLVYALLGPHAAALFGLAILANTALIRLTDWWEARNTK